MPPPSNPMPTMDQLVTQQRRRSPSTAPAAGRPAAGSGGSSAPNLLSALRGLLAANGPSQSTLAAPSTAQPDPAAASAAPSAALEETINRALANPDSDANGFTLSADHLAGLGVDMP